MIQLRIRVTDEGSGDYNIMADLVQGGTRSDEVQDGVALPSGRQDFIVPAGTVEEDMVVAYGGQDFLVVGVVPIPPFATKARIHCREYDPVRGWPPTRDFR